MRRWKRIASVQRTLFWEHSGNTAIRMNDKKLVRLRNRPWDLYDLKSDPTEPHNAVVREPELAESFQSIWNEKAGKMGVGE